MKNLCIYIFLFLSANLATLNAQNSYTLKELAQIALQKSKLLQAKNHLLKSRDGAIHQAKAWQNPSISTGGGSKIQSTSSGHWYDLSLSQPFYFPGKQELKTQIQKNIKRDALLEFEETKRFIFYKVMFLAFAYNEAIEHAEHLAERRRRFGIIQRYLNSRPFVSPQKRLAKTLVKNKILLLEKEVLEVKKKQKIIWEALNLYLDLDNAIIRIKAKWFRKGIPLDLKVLQQKLKKSPILLFQENQMKRKKLQISLTDKSKYPDFSISSVYAEEKGFQTERFLGLRLTFFLPLWNRKQGKSLQYKEELAAIAAEIAFLEKEELAKLNTAYLNYENKQELIQKYPIQMIKSTHKQMNYADREFKKGRIAILNYLELEESSSEIHTAIFESQIEYLKSYLKILSLTGSMNLQEE